MNHVVIIIINILQAQRHDDDNALILSAWIEFCFIIVSDPACVLVHHGEQLPLLGARPSSRGRGAWDLRDQSEALRKRNVDSVEIDKRKKQRALWNAQQQDATFMLTIPFSDIDDYMDKHPGVLLPTPWVQGYRFHADIRLLARQEGIKFALHPIDINRRFALVE